MASPYLDLRERCVKLDRRNTRYRFDLDADVPWSRTGEEGLYYGSGLLADLGVDVDGLQQVPEAYDTFQWALALSTCLEFIELERGILDFVDAEREALGPVRSTELLYEEEAKHIAMFVRYAELLRGQRPDLAGVLERVFHASREAPFDDPSRYPDAVSQHYGFWLSTLFFEDYTIYLHQRLSQEAADVQPAWLATHAMHRREEEQHVVTDVAHIDACRLDDAGRERWSRLAYVWLTDNLGRFIALDPPEALVRELFPDLALAPRTPFAETAFHADVLSHKLFRRTRKAWPHLQQLATGTVVEPAATETAVEEATVEQDNAVELGVKRAWKGLRSLGQSAQSMLRDVAERARQSGGAPGVESFNLRHQRVAPPLAEAARPLAEVPPVEPAPTSHLEAIRSIWSDVLDRPADSIGDDASFTELGGDSLQAVEILTSLERHLGRPLPADVLLECRTVADFARFLSREPAAALSRAAAAVTRRAEAPREIAIVAMAARLPGASDLEELWRMIADGRDAFRQVPPSRWNAADHFDRDPRVPGKTVCTAGTFLDRIGEHDAAALGMSAAEAAATDPQQRLFLELVGDLLEGTGAAGRKVGVFASAGSNDYYRDLRTDPTRLGGAAVLGNLENMVAARVAQRFALTGPALTVDAACASSHLTVHLACQSLRAGECDMAIAGASQINLGPAPFIAFSQAGVLSANQACRPFSSAADGFVPGDGAGVVLLEPLEEARRRGHEVLAIIRGSAVNNDGGALSGMAPSPEGQVAVLRQAWADAGLDPATVDLLEAHGTGTSIGDAVEAQALAHVFGDPEAPPALTSVKSNLGHLFTAAGIASVIKTVLALRHRQLPPLAGYQGPDPRIDFNRLGLAPVEGAKPWPEPANRPRRAAITGLGIGGTNVHLILDEAPAPESRARAPRDAALACIAAPNAAELDRVAGIYADRLDASSEPDAELRAINRRARRFPFRRAVVAQPDELAAALRRGGDAHRATDRPRTVLVFSGPGSQFPGMAKPLYDGAPVFRDAIDRCARILSGHLPRGLTSYLYRDVAEPPAMDRIDVTQPVVFSVGFALAEWLASLGVVADAVMGHSAGEYIAACVAGNLELEQALALVTRRGSCMSRTPIGGMAAVFADETRVRAAPVELEGLDFAAINDPSQVVLSGDVDVLERALEALEQAGIASHRLPISCGAHSPLMTSAQEALTPFARAAELGALETTFYSTARPVTYGAGDTLDADYWIEHLRAPVRFADAVDRAAGDGAELFIEVGASGGLIPCIEATLARGKHQAKAVPLLQRARAASWSPALEAIGRLAELGIDIDVDALDPGPAAATRYPYARAHHWFAGPVPVATAARPEPPRALEPSPHIRDHVARGLAIAPGATVMELALDYLGDLGDLGDDAALGDVITARPLTADLHPRVARRGERIVVESAAGEHLTARIVDGAASQDDTVDLAAIKARCPEELPVDQLYAFLATTGMRYGPTVGTVRQLWLAGDELIARLQADPGDPAGDRRFHPGVVDGAMQAIGGFAAGASNNDQHRPTYLGFSVGRLHAPRPIPDRAWAIVKIHDDPLGGGASIRASIVLADDDGRVCARFEDVGLKRVDAPAVPARSGPIDTVLLIDGEGSTRRALEDRGVFVIGRSAPRDATSARALLDAVGPIDAIITADGEPWAEVGAAVPVMTAEALDARPAAVAGGAAGFLQSQIAEALKVPVATVDPRASFAQLGLDSLMAVDMVRRLERRYQTALYPTLLFEYPTIERAAAALANRFGISEDRAP